VPGADANGVIGLENLLTLSPMDIASCFGLA